MQNSNSKPTGEKLSSLPPKRGLIKARIFEECKGFIISSFAKEGNAETHKQEETSEKDTSNSSGFGAGCASSINFIGQRVPRADESCALKVPFLFLTNGGGLPESKRASELSSLLGVKIFPSQGHSPFKTLLNRFENELIVATGKGKPAEVMTEYGFQRVLSLDEYASYFDHIDPVAHYKVLTTKNVSNCPKYSPKPVSSPNLYPDQVKAAFIVSDPVDWGRDLQVLCDILTSGGLPGEKHPHQPPLYFAADDLQYQAAFPFERLGMGAFRIALESIFNRIHDKPLEYTSFGKPNPFVFKNAEAILKEIQLFLCQSDAISKSLVQESHSFKTLYMIGDNPFVDVKGAKQAGSRWFSILTRTGVFRQKENHEEFPYDLVIDTVEDAVDFILQREINSS